jgi:peptidyl-prolyl cis-trans isomerase D
VGEPNQLSAPITGDAGVYVLQIYNQEKQDTSFDINEEIANRQYENMRFLGYALLLNELQQKANVQDNRYLFF